MNHLADASSPYLLQHCNNPVEWYPWGKAAFARAQAEQKPIFLSIGYSTCHWCHVMAHESFENKKIAALLNDSFISIKVDREERPDVDRLYMSYVQALTGSGGWPLSVWLTPTLKPFFGGTYFPPENAYERVGFPSVLLQLTQLWKENRERLEEEASQAMKALQQLVKRDVKSLRGRGEQFLQRAYEEFSASFDELWGGFGVAPKFPRPAVLFFLLEYARSHHNEEGRRAQEMVLTTLDKMAAGGVYDQLGGGFHRYSVDRIWQVPHFEKMLYDQAQLAMAYLQAFQLSGKKKYNDVALSILNYVERDMTSPLGGFYSAEDADSLDGGGIKREGAFYVWSEEEIKKILTPEEMKLITSVYQLRRDGNVSEESDPHEEFVGKNILFFDRSFDFSSPDQVSLFEKAKEKLFCARQKRSRPHRDDKILTAWNGLMVSAFARSDVMYNPTGDTHGSVAPELTRSSASCKLPRCAPEAPGPALPAASRERNLILKSKEKIEIATRAVRFIRQHLYDASSGELRHSWCAGQSSEYGFAEDYAFFIQGLLDLYEATAEQEWLQWAKQLQEKMDALFWDHTHSGYFSSAAGDPHLLLRIKEEYDGAEPSAAAIAALNHLRLSSIFQDITMAQRAVAVVHSSAATLEKMPTAVPQLLVALSLLLEKNKEPQCDNFHCELPVLL